MCKKTNKKIEKGAVKVGLRSHSTTSWVLPTAAAGLLKPLAKLGVKMPALDGIDGWVARTTGSQSAFGARFDMELDAFFILALCVVAVALQRGGVWVLWIGLARYGFIGGQSCVAWLRRPLPERFTRKLGCVWQVGTLLVCLAPGVSNAIAHAALLLALTLLAASFARDLLWLYRRRTRPAWAAHCASAIRPPSDRRSGSGG